jgi:hypothetical protein
MLFEQPTRICAIAHIMLVPVVARPMSDRHGGKIDGAVVEGRAIPIDKSEV